MRDDSKPYGPLARSALLAIVVAALATACAAQNTESASTNDTDSMGEIVDAGADGAGAQGTGEAGADGADSATDIGDSGEDGTGKDVDDAKVSADAQPAKDIQTDVTPKPKPVLPSMEYAPLPGPVTGTIECGPGVAPYFWATKEPAPLACTTTCPSAAHANATVCAGGQCLVTSCESGWQDVNGYGADGCEVSTPVACILYVEEAAAPTAADGSVDHPFDNIPAAVAAAVAGCEIRVGAGTFDQIQVQSKPACSGEIDCGSTVILDKPGLMLRGAGPAVTAIRFDQDKANPAFPILHITADNVVVEGLSILGMGVGLAADASAPLIRNVAVGPLTAPWNVGPLYGMNLQASKTAHVTASWVHGLSRSNSCQDSVDLGVTGVRAGPDARILGTLVSALQGGGFSDSAGCYCPGCPVGRAVGVEIKSGIVSGCAAQTLKSGAPTTLEMSGNVASTSPNPARAFIGAPFDLTNRHDGEPSFQLNGCLGLTLKNVTTSDALNVIDSSNVFVENVSVTHLDGPGLSVVNSNNVQILNSTVTSAAPGILLQKSPSAKITGNKMKAGGGLGDLVGLNVQECGNCQITQNTISLTSSLVNSYSNTNKPPKATGMFIGGCTGCALSNNTIQSVSGSSAAPQKLDYADGGDASGIEVSGTGLASFTGNAVYSIHGGWPAAPQKPYGPKSEGDGGAAFGIVLAVSNVQACNHLAVGNVQPGGTMSFFASPPYVYKNPPVAYATKLPSGSVCDHVTIADTEHAVFPGAAVTFTNSILATDDACELTSNKNISLSYSDLWGKLACGTGALGVISVDPQLVDVKNHDLHLQTSSLCVDAGDPGAPFCSESVPNGCRTDMGAYGNTSQSTSLTGAKTCACP